MKKMLIVLAALTVMGAGFAMAEDQKTEPKGPSQAYKHGYNMAARGSINICGPYASSRTQSESSKESIEYDCNQGYFQGKEDKKQSEGN